MRFLVPLTAAPVPPGAVLDGLGGKARSLLRLRAVGARTPPGFVVKDEVFRALVGAAGPGALHTESSEAGALDEATLRALDGARAAVRAGAWPAGFTDELRQAVADLGVTRLAVRSSFAGEDEAGALAAGVYESRVDVTPAAVEEALRAVLASALSAGALAYAHARGRPVAAPPVAVLIHAYLDADASGLIALAPPGPAVLQRSGAVTPAAQATLEAVTARAAAAHGPVELEWAARGDEVVFLQLRPHHPPAPAPPWPGWADLPPGEPPAAWRWDAAHNPAPLSPAQAGLVALVDAACRTGLRQRVLGGYLFWAPGGPEAEPLAPADAPAAFAALAARAEAALARLGPAPALEAALALFVSVYEPLLGRVQPAARQARRALEGWLAAHAPAHADALPALLGGVPSAASARAALAARIRAAAGDPARAEAVAAYLARFGDEAPAWDVAAPGWSERPDALIARLGRDEGEEAGTSPAAGTSAGAAARIRGALPPARHADFDHLLEDARAAAALREDDDALYARVQAGVRRALRALGARLHADGRLDDPDDVFSLPLSIAREAAAGTSPHADLRALAAEGRAAVARAERQPPPLAAAAGLEAAAPTGGRLFRGHGTGGRTLGRAVQRDDGAAAGPLGPGDVLLARSLLPTELPLLFPAALVTELGGPLDHVAAQARERGLPAVVGAPGIAAIPTGARVLVDADAGLVIVLAAD